VTHRIVPAWRTLCHEAVKQFEDLRVEALEHKKVVRKGVQPHSNFNAWSCDSTVVPTSAAPKLDFTPINKLTDDKLFVVSNAQSMLCNTVWRLSVCSV